MLAEEIIETRAARHRRVARGASAALAALRSAALPAKPNPAAKPAPTYVPPYEVMWFYDLVEMRPKRVIADHSTPSLRLIQHATCEHFRISRSDLISHRRHAAVCFARHVSYYLAKEMTTLTLTEIGRLSGRRDHSTITHGTQKIATLIARDAGVANHVREVRAAIEREVMR